MGEEKGGIPVIRVSGFGSFTVPGLGEGRVAGSARISQERIDVSGSNTLPGGMKVREVEASGRTTFKGDLDAERMDISGSASIEGAARFGRMTKSGSLRIDDDATGASMDVSGSTRVGGTIRLEDELRSSGSIEVGGDLTVGGLADIEGSLGVKGRLKAGTLDIRLHGDASRVDGGIEAEKIRIRRHGQSLPHSDGILETKDVKGDDICIEDVRCGNVTGTRVIIGDGCEVRGVVTYSKRVDVRPGASLRNPPVRSEP
jgi:cytoskeletal protein CcmA (bactofilin family)